MSVLSYTPGNIPTYRFYISEASSVTYEVFPLKFLDTALIDTREKGQVFYRRKFKGSLVFGTNSIAIDEHGVEQNRKDDWTFLWNQEQHDPCAMLYLTVTKEVEGVISTYCECQFSTTDGKFDIDQCTFEVEPVLIDDYTEILDKEDLQYNILSITDIATTSGGGKTYDRNRWIFHTGDDGVIEYLARKIAGVTVAVTSTFFSAANNPVTGAANKVNHLVIAQKSDIIRPAGAAATTAMMSWTELMDILRGMFQVYWKYDITTHTIEVEHISHWANIAGLDLRTQLTTVATNKYSYIKESMPKYEKFSFVEADNVNFVGVPIWYNSACVNIDEETEISVNVTTDIEYIQDDPDAIGDDGFVILADNGAGVILSEVGALHGDTMLNMHLSWANLHHYYFRYNRVLIDGFINNIHRQFWTAQKTKQQECSAIICDIDDYDPEDEITTELGFEYFGDGTNAGNVAGIVDSSELKPTGEMKFKLLYGPQDIDSSILADKFMTIAEQTCVDPLSNCSDFIVTIDPAATVQMHIIVTTIARYWTGSHWHEEHGHNTWTINIGETGGNFEAQSHADTADCIRYEWDFTDFDDWIIDVLYDTNFRCE